MLLYEVIWDLRPSKILEDPLTDDGPTEIRRHRWFAADNYKSRDMLSQIGKSFSQAEGDENPRALLTVLIKAPMENI